jgi:hypothetical protein
MVNRTPLRLVAIEDFPPTEDEQSSPTEEERSGAPVAMMGEQDMVTRKVPEAEMIASQDTFRDKPKLSSGNRLVLPAIAVAVVVSAAVIALVVKGRSTKAPVAVPISAVAVPTPSPSESPQPQAAVVPVAPVAPAQPKIKAAPEIIRLTIAADPTETELSLDGNVVASHRLNLEVPKDRGIHVVSASAPGYIPFNQQVSFSSDVVLKISLHRSHMPAPVHQVAKARPSQQAIEPSPKSNFRPAAAPSSPGMEPGMTLDGPSPRHSGKPIDERNPYKP